MKQYTMNFIGFDSFTSKKGNLVKVVDGYYEDKKGHYKTVQGFTESDFSDLMLLDEVPVVISYDNGKATIMRVK